MLTRDLSDDRPDIACLGEAFPALALFTEYADGTSREALFHSSNL
jgi:hypothetical protein